MSFAERSGVDFPNRRLRKEEWTVAIRRNAAAQIHSAADEVVIASLIKVPSREDESPRAGRFSFIIFTRTLNRHETF